MENIIASEEEMFPEPPTTEAAGQTSEKGKRSPNPQGQYVRPVEKPRQKKTGPERELDKRAVLMDMMKICRNRKSFNIADYVQGGFAQVKPMEWSMIDFDYLRNTAYLFYVRIAMLLADLLRVTLHSEFIDYMLDVSEKTLTKDILNIESETVGRI